MRNWAVSTAHLTTLLQIRYTKGLMACRLHVHFTQHLEEAAKRSLCAKAVKGPTHSFLMPLELQTKNTK